MSRQLIPSVHAFHDYSSLVLRSNAAGMPQLVPSGAPWAVFRADFIS